MKYRKKPVLVEAFQWCGFPEAIARGQVPQWLAEAFNDGTVNISPHNGRNLCLQERPGLVTSHLVPLRPGDWIICDADGELECCRADSFTATYEACERVADEHARIVFVDTTMAEVTKLLEHAERMDHRGYMPKARAARESAERLVKMAGDTARGETPCETDGSDN